MYFYYLLIVVALGGGIACVIGCQLHAKRKGISQPRIVELVPHIIGSAMFACVVAAFLTHVVVSVEITAIAKRAAAENRDLTLNESHQVHELSQWWIGKTL